MKEAKDFLYQAINIEKEITALKMELLNIELAGQNIISNYSGINIKGSRKKEANFENSVDKYLDKINEKIKQLSETKAEIFLVIDTVEDNLLRTLLIHRFLNGYTLTRTSKLMNYSRKQTYRLQEKAFKKVDEILKMSHYDTK